MRNALSRAWLLFIPVAALAVSLVYPTLSAYAEPPAADPQPQIVYQYPKEGARLKQPPFGIQLCFASPINIKDLDRGGDFAFDIKEPDGVGIGSRDVFQSDGWGITIYPGAPVGDAAGQWLFHFRVTSPDAQSALEGDINYSVDHDGSSVPLETPPPCTASGGPASTSSGNDSDVLKYGLIAAAAAGVVVLFGLILFVVGRRRRGRSARRPETDAAARSDWSASGPRATPTPVARIETSSSQPGTPARSPTPPPLAEGGTRLPEWSRSISPVPPRASQSETPLPESRPSPSSATPTEDVAVDESADHNPGNSRYALLAIGAAVILLIGVFVRRRGGREKPGDDDGDPD